MFLLAAQQLLFLPLLRNCRFENYTKLELRNISQFGGNFTDFQSICILLLQIYTQTTNNFLKQKCDFYFFNIFCVNFNIQNFQFTAFFKYFSDLKIYLNIVSVKFLKIIKKFKFTLKIISCFYIPQNSDDKESSYHFQ